MADKEPILLFCLDKPCNQEELRKLLCRSEFKDSRVAVISVCGKFRKEKSFLLNLLSRYLRAKGEANWFVDGQSSNEFRWENSSEPVNKGILLYPELFTIKLNNGDRMTILLIDSQGNFDAATSLSENTAISSFSMMLSSIHIVNIKGDIDGDDLINLELFSQTGKMLAGKDSGSAKPFQELIFLIRDWSSPSQYPFGWEGGKDFLSARFNPEQSKEEIKALQDNIKDCFDLFKCFLIPYPGEHIAYNEIFSNNPKDIDKIFLDKIEAFLFSLIAQLEPKRIGGKDVRLNEFCGLVSVIEDILKTRDFPEAHTYLKALTEPCIREVLDDCRDRYQEIMLDKVRNDPIEEHQLSIYHHVALEEQITRFDSVFKAGDPEYWEAARKAMQKQLESDYKNISILNKSNWNIKMSVEENAKMMKQMEDLQKEVGECKREILKMQQEQTAGAQARQQFNVKSPWDEFIKLASGPAPLFRNGS